MQEPKAREFWINCYEGHSVFVAHRTKERSESDRSNPCDEHVHVIEYSAYEKLKWDIEQYKSGVLNFKCFSCGSITSPIYTVNLMTELESERAKLATCVEALERVRVLCRNAGFPMVRTDFIAPIIAEALANIKGSKELE